MEERTTEGLAAEFPKGTPIEPLVRFMRGIGARCEEGKAKGDEIDEGLLECFYTNVSYSTGIAKPFTRMFYFERTAYWRVTIRRSGKLINETLVAVEAEDRFLEKQKYTELRNAQIKSYESEKTSSSQGVTHGEN